MRYANHGRLNHVLKLVTAITTSFICPCAFPAAGTVRLAFPSGDHVQAADKNVIKRLRTRPIANTAVYSHAVIAEIASINCCNPVKLFQILRPLLVRPCASGHQQMAHHGRTCSCTPASFREPGVPTIMTASSDMELERETSRFGPGKYVLRQPKRGGLLKTYLSIQHLPSKKSICPGQQIPKRVRFVGVSAHDSDPGDTRLIRGRTEHCVEDQHSRSSVATDERTEWSAGQMPLRSMDEGRASQGLLHRSSSLQDAKIWRGMKYERKAQGPFAGWMVSQGTIITLDGEEYVEYRVLVKPAVYSHSLRGSSCVSTATCALIAEHFH